MDINYSVSQKVVLGLLITVLFALGLASSSGNKPVSGILAQEREFFLIDTNKATAEELRLLPYVSADMAQEIIRYRQEKGTIKDTEELLAIKGIGPTKLKKLKNHLKCLN